MLSIDPKDRKSAELYLDQERGQLFPEYFYTFLQSYFQMFSSIPILPSDDKITRLHSDISQIIDMLGDRSGDQDDCSKDHCRLPPDKDGLTLITTVVTSCIRGLHHCNSKISCLEILLKLAEHTSSETVLDRILPYIVSSKCYICFRCLNKYMKIFFKFKASLHSRSFSKCTSGGIRHLIRLLMSC